MDGFSIAFLLIMICALFILSLSQALLLPIVFSVQRTNAIVLSFFAIVPMDEILSFANRCERFLLFYVERKQENKMGSSAGKYAKKEENKMQKSNDKSLFEIANDEGVDHLAGGGGGSRSQMQNTTENKNKQKSNNNNYLNV